MALQILQDWEIGQFPRDYSIFEKRGKRGRKKGSLGTKKSPPKLKEKKYHLIKLKINNKLKKNY